MVSSGTMARYKPYHYGQQKLIPVSFEAQILPDTSEHTIVYRSTFDQPLWESFGENNKKGLPVS